VIAARAAASSLATPLAKEATRLARARSIHGVSPASTLRRTINWNSAMISRASTSVGAPDSIAANRDRLRFRKRVPPDRHETRDRPGRRDSLKGLRVGLFGSSPAHDSGRPRAGRDGAARSRARDRRRSSYGVATRGRHGIPVNPLKVATYRKMREPLRSTVSYFSTGANLMARGLRSRTDRRVWGPNRRPR
jgi:hypothetical protein